ncbi:MAG TPA: hypothetical protein VFP61_13040 [Acidimicrobiales bacterium]|nr:hypothetical protein [Acidimicrobiales bacterium]
MVPDDARRDRLERMARIVLRPIGSPLPLGMIALAAGSIVLTGLQLRWVPVSSAHQVALVVLVFTVPMQVLGSVFGFLARDGAGGTGLATLAGTWAVTGVLMATAPPGSRSPVLGLLLCVAAAAVLVPATAAAFGKVAIGLAFAMAAARFAVTGVYQLHGGVAWRSASGWLGLALCIVALYCAFAAEVEDTRHRTTLPLLRHGAGRAAMDGSVLDDLNDVERDAGVRGQL